MASKLDQGRTDPSLPNWTRGALSWVGGEGGKEGGDRWKALAANLRSARVLLSLQAIRVVFVGALLAVHTDGCHKHIRSEAAFGLPISKVSGSDDEPEF